MTVVNTVIVFPMLAIAGFVLLAPDALLEVVLHPGLNKGELIRFAHTGFGFSAVVGLELAT